MAVRCRTVPEWLGMRGRKMLEDLVVWYLFLGGAGAGLLFVSTVLEMLSPQAIDSSRACQGARYAPKPVYRRFFGPSYGVGIAAVALGMLCLLLDLGRSDRALAIFLQPTLSFISVGAYALAALVALAAVLAAIWLFGVDFFHRLFVRVLRVFVAIASLVVMAYTGLFLASMPSVPLWATPWIPPLFVASALSSGIALMVCAVVLTGSGGEFKATLQRMQKIDAAVIVCEILLLGLFVLAAFLGSETARMSAERLLAGDLAALFWGIVVVLGLVVPLACEALNRRMGARAAVFSGILVLAGGFFLRWCIAQAGMAPDIVSSVMAALGIQ